MEFSASSAVAPSFRPPFADKRTGSQRRHFDLPDNEPTAVTLSVTRLDGYRESLQRRTIFLVKTGESEVAAFTRRAHLGCLVAWDRRGQVFRCPCHGGVFDRTGAVMDGPPPESLAKIAVRVDGNRVMVQA